MTQPTAPWYSRVGPGLITACVVIGPGSILTSSKVGADNGYAMLWIVLVSVVFMLIYMTLGAKLGAVPTESPGELIKRKAGRWLAVLVGISIFIISSAYQAGNNMGVGSAFEAFVDSKKIVMGLIIAFNAVAIAFLFAFKNLYKVLEKLMMTFVGLMLISFAVNLVRLRPDPVAMAKGIIPSTGQLDLALIGLIGTTFVISAAFYQAYLVQQKGWGEEQVKSSMLDARVGSVIMAIITIMLMSTAAAGLVGVSSESLKSVVFVAEALEPTFGSSGKIIFCVGLFCAAYSSFLINSMIGGFILSDGLGLGWRADDLWPRLLTALVLLVGMFVAIAVLLFDFDRAPMIIAAQALTVVAAPLVAAVLLWLTSSSDVMREHKNGPIVKVFALLGLVMLIAMGMNSASKLPGKIKEYRNVAPAPVEAPVKP